MRGRRHPDARSDRTTGPAAHNPADPAGTLLLRNLGVRPYVETWQAMQAFAAERTNSTLDELWLLEHPPVYTLGLNGNPRHIRGPVTIPVIQSDRGGQVTFHGPGQLIVYALIDLHRKACGVRTLVSALENSVIHLLKQYGILAHARREAPGVYVRDCKIASLGLRVKRRCSYHGLSLNVDLNLEPFALIDPCGYPNLTMTRLKDLGVDIKPLEAAAPLVSFLASQLHYHTIVASHE